MGMNTESGYSQAYYSISTHTPYRDERQAEKS